MSRAQQATIESKDAIIVAQTHHIRSQEDRIADLVTQRQRRDDLLMNAEPLTATLHDSGGGNWHEAHSAGTVLPADVRVCVLAVAEMLKQRNDRADASTGEATAAVLAEYEHITQLRASLGSTDEAEIAEAHDLWDLLDDNEARIV